MQSQGKLFEYVCELLGVDPIAGDSGDLTPYICDDIESMLLEIFVDKIAIWLDLYSPIPLFGQIVTQISIIEKTGILRSCIFACCALYLHGSNPETYDTQFCLRFHNSALQQLRIQLASEDRQYPKLLLCSLILVVEGLFFGESSTFLHHVMGSWALLLEVLNMTAASDKQYGFLFTQACYYTIKGIDFAYMTRFNVAPAMDFAISEFGYHTTAYGLETDRIRRECKLLTSEHEIDYSKTDVASKDKVWWLQESLYLLWDCFRFKRIPYVETEKDVVDGYLATKWLELRHRIDNFERCIPTNFRPLVYGSPSESPDGETIVQQQHVSSSPDSSSSSNSSNARFMEIYFLNEQAAVVYMNLCYAKILLAESIERTGLVLTKNELKSSKKTTVRRTKRGTHTIYRGPLLALEDEFSDRQKRKMHIRRCAKEILGVAESYGSESIVSIQCVGYIKYALKLLKKTKRRE